MDNNFTVTPNGENYITKMDDYLKSVMNEWWKSLSKEEILTYLLQQPSITADHLRSMLANEQCMMMFEVKFAVANGDATANFHTNSN